MLPGPETLRQIIAQTASVQELQRAVATCLASLRLSDGKELTGKDIGWKMIDGVRNGHNALEEVPEYLGIRHRLAELLSSDQKYQQRRGRYRR